MITASINGNLIDKEKNKSITMSLIDFKLLMEEIESVKNANNLS